MVKKALQSAIANAENNHDLDVDDLVVAEARRQEFGDEALPCPARGNAGGIEKGFRHLTIVDRRRKARRKSPRRRKLPNGSES